MKIKIESPQVLLSEGEGFAVRPADIYIEEDKIISVGEKVTDFVPDRTIDGTDKLVIPGLINMHTHNYMTVFRNLADDVSFNEWLFERVMPREDRMTPEDAYLGATLGIMEMLRSGTTCFNDMQMHIHQTTKAAVDAGIRASIGRGLSGDADEEGGEMRIRQALEEMEAWKDEPLLTFTMAPHAPYTCTGKYMQKAAAIAREKNVPLHIHLSESTFEVENMKKEQGMSPIAYADSLGLLDQPVIIAHCVKVDDEDIRLLVKPTVSVVTNPASNMKLGNGFAPIPKMLEAGVNVCIGTDGAASNNALNLFREMGLVTLIHKGAMGDAESVSAVQALKMATENAAKALGRADSLGRIAKGYQADLAILDLNAPQMMPRNNIVSSLTYSANGSEVETVIVRGEIVMENRRFTRIDEEWVRSEVRRREV